MNYSKIQKIIASVIIPFFFFGMIFNLPINNIINYSSAGETKLYSIVSILVEEDIYDDVYNSIETYSEDISKQLKNTKVIIIPTPKNATPFQIASLNERLYYEGYEGVKKNTDFKSKLVGTVLVGNFPIPVVYKNKKNSTSILPYVDFEDKSYIYNHQTDKYEKNNDNISGIKPDIWHGVITPNTGDKKKDIQAIKDFFDKNHDFYQGKGNFKKDYGIINGKINEKNPNNYKPYVFYFDQIREQQSISYPKYLGYQSYLKNKEAIVYNRYSLELAESIKSDVFEPSKEEINNLIGKINPNFKSYNKSFDTNGISDIMSKSITDNTIKKFIEIVNSSKIGEFRKDVNNSGRYSNSGNKVNIDLIPHIISVLDEIGDQSIKGANNILEDRINDLVISGGLSRYIALPTTINHKNNHFFGGNSQGNFGALNSNGYSVNCFNEYENILFGNIARNIQTAEDCSFYKGNNENGGKLVEANRGFNIYKIKDDVNLCRRGNTSGYWGGVSPLNLKDSTSTNGEFILKSSNYKSSIRPLFDIKGAKYVSDNSKVPSPLNCFENNFFVSYEENLSYLNTSCVNSYQLPINGRKAVRWQCSTNNKKYIFNQNFSTLYNSVNGSYACNEERKIVYLNGKKIKESPQRVFNILNLCNLDEKKYYFKTIKSHIKHISPTIEELGKQINSKISPNLPINVDRYIDFIGANGKYLKIKYPNLFDLKDPSNLDNLLDKESIKINNIIVNNNPSSLKNKEKEIYNLLKIANYPNKKINLKKLLKEKENIKIDILGEKKEISLYENIKFSLFWNNLDTVGQKYKFVFENYLSDQTSSKFKHYLPKNKKLYEIAYLGAPGNSKNMYIGVNPEEKGENPYYTLDTQNALLNAEIFSYGIQYNDILKTNFNNKAVFKCAPPEGVSIFEWPGAIICWINNLSVEIDFGNSKRSSETLFLDDNYKVEEKIISNFIDTEDNNILNNGYNTELKKDTSCKGDLNKNGIGDCLEKDFKNAKIEITSSSKKVYINSYVGLESRIIGSNGKVLKDINNLKTTFEIIKIVDSKSNKNIEKKDFHNYIKFNERIVFNQKGISKYSFNSKNKEAKYYFKATTFLEGKDKKEIMNLKSNIIQIEVSKDLLLSKLNKINEKNIFNNLEDEILASDKSNIYLLDLNKTNIDKELNKIKANSSSKEKIIISLSYYSGTNKQIPLQYPLKLSLTRNGEKIVETLNITEDNLSNFYPLYSLSKKGEYKLTITSNSGEITTNIFNIIPEKANDINIHLSTNILEKNGNTTSNVFILKDKYGNISNGYNYKIILKSNGEFSFPLNGGENLNKKEILSYEGYKGFRLKPSNKNGSGKIDITVMYNNKIIASKTKGIQTIEKINIDLIKTEKFKVGFNKSQFKINFKDKQGNLLKNLNTRVYFSINKDYGISEKAYFEVKNGKTTIKFKTTTLSGENIPIELKIEGLRGIIKENITINPDKPIKLDFDISKKIAKASPNEKISVKVKLKDKYDNTVFSDSSTNLKFEIKPKYKKILNLNSSNIKKSQKGEVIFDLSATLAPGLSYFKVSTIPNLSINKFDINGKTISGLGEKSGKIKTYYFWNKDSFKDKKYNSIYTVMLGADYGNIAEKDYLAGSILFNRNNRSLAITTLLNTPYNSNESSNTHDFSNSLSGLFSNETSLNKFASAKIDDLENFIKKGSIGWKGENKFLLNFASGEKVGESVMDKQSFGTIVLGDPVISLKPIRINFKDGITEKSFTSTIGKKLSNDNDIYSYQIFDYDNDNLKDILLVKNNGFLKLLENKPNSKTFLDKGNLAYIADHGNKEFIKTGDFTGDGFSDIFFVNDKGIPELLNNIKKDFVRIDLEKQFKLKGKIVQVESFDMDNDGKADLITLDDLGEINIFYGGGSQSTPSFTKKNIGSTTGLTISSASRNNGALISFDGIYQLPKTPNNSNGIVNQDFLNRQIFVSIPQKGNTETGLSNEKTFIKSEYSESFGLEVKKIFKDINGGTLQTGDIVEVEITIKNTSNRIKRNISYLDKLQKPFLQEKSEIEKTKGEIIKPIPGYDYSINSFNLVPGGTNIIKYRLKTPYLSYGSIKVGLFEKGELGDDNYGDIIIKNSKQNCSTDSKIYKSISAKTYSDLSKNILSCNENKLKLPDQLEKNKIDNNSNGIPDYIDEIINNPKKQKEYAQKQFKKLNEEENKNIQEKAIEQLDKINEQVDRNVEYLDNLMEGFSCGFGGGSCISTPLNWAPLAPGNDPTLFGNPIGDGLKVGEGIPIFSAMTDCLPVTGGCIPFVWPPISGGAGGYLGINYPLNKFRLFVTPTLTGGVGTAVCFGGPASVAGNSIPSGVSPLVPGGNCIVTAKPLLGCSNDGSEGDPESMGKADYFGVNGNNQFGVINGNCSVNTGSKNKVINQNFINEYVSGLGNPTTFKTSTFKNNYKNALKGFNTKLNGNLENPLFSLNGEGVGEQSLSISANFSNLEDGNFEDIIQIKKDRISPFPSFLMDWVTRQIEEVVTKLSDFPTIFLVLPDFSGIIDTDWTEYGKKADEEYIKSINKEKDNNKSIEEKIKNFKNELNSLNCNGENLLKCSNLNYKIGILESQKVGNFGKGQMSGIKAAYDFLGNVPLIELEPQQVNISIPWPDVGTLDKFLADSKSALNQWENEINSGKMNGNANSDINALVANLKQNISIVEEYKQFPRKLTKLLNQKEIWVNQIMYNIEEISEITSGWIGRNGKRFKAWVETYILIKSILKSWQLLIDVFTDYEAECYECKNERQDLLEFEFKLIDMILPKFPVIQFPKWPDLILDLHNVRAGITLKIPDIVINQRPIVLPNIPNLTLPRADINIDLDVPTMPLLPRFDFPELPDLPLIPIIRLPDLPPPPQLPRIFTQLEGVLKILKLITKALCLLKQLPFVPEWRAGDQIAFLTERNGYLSTDFIDISLPKFTIPSLDAIKVTTFVNLETDTTFLVETLRDIISPINDKTSNWKNNFSNSGLDNLDYSNKSINIYKDFKIDENLELNEETSFSKDTSEKIVKLYSYINKNKDKEVNSREFLYLVNKSLTSPTFTKSSRTEGIIKLWKDVNNYNYSKEDKFIIDLKKNNYEKFDNLNKILNNELRKTYKLKKDLKNYINKDKNLFLKINGEIQNKDFIIYKKSLEKFNNNFLKSAKKLVDGTLDIESKQIKEESKNLLSRINGGLKKFNANALNSKLLANNINANNSSKNSCQQSSDYGYNYKGLYIVEKNKSYRLFNYLDELNGNEVYSSIDFDKDGDQDLLYLINGEIYLKENLSIFKEKEIIGETPLELKIKNNIFFNGTDFIESINGFKEINTSNGLLNLSFKSPTDKNIKHFVIEYYTTVDKFLNKSRNDGVQKHIIDAFVESSNVGRLNNNEQKKHKSYISYIGDIPAVKYYTFEMQNISISLKNNNKINLSSTTPLYTGSNSAKIKYYIGKNKENILEKEIEKNSSIRFKEKITIISLNGNLYTKLNKKISLVGADIKKYIGLPLFEESEFTVIPDLKNKMVLDLANIEIKYSSGYKKLINFNEINSYSYYNLGNVSNDYLINLSTNNDYYYGKIYSVKGSIKGTYSKQVLFSPQVEADKIAPVLEGLSKIKIPIYQKKKINLKTFIYENSGIKGIRNVSLKLSDTSNILANNYIINKTLNTLDIEFGKFNILFKEKIEIILEDNNGNKSITPINFEVYSPKPTILSNIGNKIYGKINEELIGEPINIYRIRAGGIKRLETKDNKVKVDTLEKGIFNFDAKGETSSGLILEYNNKKIATINENNGKIKILNSEYKVKVENDESNFPKIVINDTSGNSIYSQFIRIKNNIEVIKVNNFDNIENNGLYLKVNSLDYNSYNIPNGANFSAGVNVIYKKNNSNKKALFTIFPDGRLKYNVKYYIDYKINGTNITLELKSKVGNKKIAELLYKINGTYLMK